MVCSESGSEDKETSLLSVFNILDKVQFSRSQSAGNRKAAPLVQLRVTAVWMQEKGDSDNEFEFSVVLRPPHGEEIAAGGGTFCFTLPLFRVTAKLIGGLPFNGGEGILWIECRVRKVGAKGWQARQEYPIFVEELPALDDAAKPENAKAEMADSPTP